MKLSVVVNNYNYERFVREAIDSALDQSAVDVEVVVVDDGSTDGSRLVIESYGTLITPVYRSNGGQGAALSQAFESVTGDIVIFLDADDTLLPGIAERVVQAFEHEPDLARVQWPLQTVDALGRPNGPVVPSPSMMPSGDLRQHIVRYRTHVWPATSGNAFSRRFLARLMPVPPECRLGTDLYLAETSALLGPVQSLLEPGGTYRVHGSNIWTRDYVDLSYLHQKIEWTNRNHIHVKRIASEVGVACPADARVALDVAFLCQRLASLRLDATTHPMIDDRRLALTARGLRAASAHPHHTRSHKVKRIAWLLGTGLGPSRLARHLIERLYFRPRG